MTKESMVRPRVFLDIGIDQVEAGRIVVELFSDVCPRTCENFRCLCTGEKGIGSSTGKALHYKNVVFHRVIHGFMLQAGDFSEGNGRGGESIYGGYFEDESFDLKHDKPFLLSMANRGVNTNGSQFFITTQTTPHLNGKHVVFGRVVSGENVVKQVESQKTDANNRPLKECKIVHCGELVLAKSKKKHKKHKLSTDGSAASTDDDELSGGEKKKKKIKRKHKHKKEKKHKKKHKQEQEAQATAVKNKENEADDEIIGSISSIKPEEIPEVPENRFLGRFNSKEKERLDEERTVTNSSTGDSRQWTTRSGRKIKGRGALRYRTPSRSRSRSMSPRSGRRTHSSRLHSASSSSRRANDTARKGSETPPHWRDAQERRSQRSLRERLNEYGDSEDDAAEGNERWKKNSPGVRARRRARSGADGDCMKSHNGGYKGRNNRGKGSNDDDDDDGHKATLRDVPRQHSSSDNSGDDLENTNVKKRKRLSTGGRHRAKDDEQDNRRDCSHDAQKQTSSSAQHNSSKDDHKRQRRSRHNRDSSDEVTEDQLDLTSGNRNIQDDNESKQSRKHLDEKTNRRSDHHESPRGHRNSTGNRNHSPRDHRGLAQDKHGSPIHHHDSSGDLRNIKDSMELVQKSSDSSSDESNSVNNRNMTQTVESYPINATDCSKSPEPNHSISASAATKKLKKIDSTACQHDSSNDSDHSDDINLRDMVKTSGSNSKEHNNDRTLVSTHKVISARDMCKLSNETQPDSRDHRHRGSSSEHSDSITAHPGSHESTLLSNKSTKCSEPVKASPDSLNECNNSRSDHSDSDGSSKNKSTKTYKKLSAGDDDSSGSYDSTKDINKLTYLKKQEASKVVHPPGNFGESYNDFKSPEKQNCSGTSPINKKQASTMSTKADLDTNSSLDQGEKQQSTKNRTDSIGDCNVITCGSSNQQSHHSREDKLLAGANSGKDAATAELSASQKEILDKYIPTSDAVESSHVKEESVNVPNEAKIANFGALAPQSVNISPSSVILSNSTAPVNEGKNHNCENSEVSKDNAEDRSEKPTQTIVDAISGGDRKGLSEIKSTEGDASGMSQDIATMESIQEETITLNVTEETMEVVKAQENILQQPAILKHESQDKEPDKSDLDSNQSSSSSPIRKKPADDSSDTSPTKQRKSSHRSRSRDRKRSKSRDRKRSKSRERKRAKSRDRRRSRSRNRKRSTSRDRKRSRSRDLRRNRMRSRSRDRRRSRSPDRRRISSRDRKRSRSRSPERRRARRSRSRDRRHSRRRSRSRSKRRSRSRSRRRSRSRSRRRTPLASAYRRDRRRSSDRYRRSRSRNRSPRSKRRRTRSRSRSRSAARRRRLRESARRRSSPSRSHSRGSGERKSARRRSASVKKKPARANSTSSSSSEERAKAAVRRKNAIKRKISRSSSTSSSSGSDSSD